MRKRTYFLATAVMLVALLAVPGSMALAGHRIQDEGSGTVTLDKTGDAPEQATGTARFRLTDDDEGFHRVRMRLRVRNLPERAGNVFSVWWRDNETDYDDAVGTFQTDNDGDGGLTVTKSLPHFAEYDEILVSSEPKHDSNPKLQGPILLRGDAH